MRRGILLSLGEGVLVWRGGEMKLDGTLCWKRGLMNI